MAHTFDITRTFTGESLLLVHIFIKSDGASPDLTDKIVIDPVVDLGLTSATRMAIEDIRFGLSGFVARVEFDTGMVDDKMIWVLTENVSYVDFRPVSKLRDKSGVDGTGKLQISTTGLTDADAQGSIIIQVRI